MGVTGSGKTFTMANVVQAVQRPTLVMSHNKTLAAQLYSEFKEFFPNNAVHYFVSYYDYYQPEAYIPQRDIYIEKDASINQQIDRLRLAATSAGQPPRRADRGQRVEHLRTGLAGRLPRDDGRAERGQGRRSRFHPRQAGRYPVRAGGLRVPAGQVPRPRRLRGNLAELRGSRPAGRVLGRRGRAAFDHQSHQRRGDRAQRGTVHLPLQALRLARGADQGRRGRDQARVGRTAGTPPPGRQDAGGPPAQLRGPASTSR